MEKLKKIIYLFILLKNLFSFLLVRTELLFEVGKRIHWHECEYELVLHMSKIFRFIEWSGDVYHFGMSTAAANANVAIKNIWCPCSANDMFSSFYSTEKMKFFSVSRAFFTLFLIFSCCILVLMSCSRHHFLSLSYILCTFII